MADMKIAISFPAGPKRPVGLLLDVATPGPIFDTEGKGIGKRWLQGVRWQSLGCDPLLTQPANDCTYTQNLTPEDFPGVVEQMPFNIYDSLNCSALSDPADEIRKRLQGRMDLMESAAFGAELLSGASSGALSLSSEAHAPTGIAFGSAATTALNALSALEADLASTLHGGRGMIHVSPAMLPLLVMNAVVQLSDGRWISPSGHQVVADAGYTVLPAPDGETAAGATEEWMYSSGPVHYYKTTPSFRGLPGEQIDYTSNRIDSFIDEYALLLFEPCAVAAVLASYSVS